MGVQALTLQTDFGLLPNIRSRDLNDKVNEALNILAAPATKQLALLSVTGIDDEFETNTFIEGAYKDMIDFGSAGPPSTFPPIVATSDGSQCGRLQSTSPHQELTRNIGAYLLNVFVVNVGFKSDVVVNALPAYGTQDRLAHFRAYFTISILWAHIDIVVVNRNYTSPANTLPYETLPGGYVNPADQQSLAGGFFRPFFWNVTFLYNGPICFVPSYSALDVSSITAATAAEKYLYGAMPAGGVMPRVDKFIAMEQTGGTYNQSHLRFTARNSEWIFDEMQGTATTTLNCQTECNPFAIVTSGFVSNPCPGTNATLTIPNLPAGATVAWTALSGTVTSGTGPTFVTQPDGSGSPLSGNAVITTAAGCQFGANFSLDTTPITGTFGYAPPQALVPASAGAINVASDPYATIVFASEQGVRYTFTMLSGSQYAYFREFDFDADLDFNSPNQIVSIEISKTTATCGTVTQTFNFMWTPTMRQPAPVPTKATPAALYPNPARETVDVYVDNADAAHPVTVRLFDGYGRPCAEQTSRGEEATVRLRTDKLPAGLYFVHILRGGKVLSRQQLRIEK